MGKSKFSSKIRKFENNLKDPKKINIPKKRNTEIQKSKIPKKKEKYPKELENIQKC